MVNRSQRILLELMEATGPLTSQYLAEHVGVSARTIKATMPQVAKMLSENGARLESRRNRGYSITVMDNEAYTAFFGSIRTKAIHIAMAGYDDTTRILHICRKLVAAPAGAKIDEICEDLCLSRSAVRKPLRQARAFCESFHLKITSSPGGGICVYGEERMVRLAMVEFFEIHFHKFSPDETDREYDRWIGCDYQERQDIRHVFLKVLRESGVSMRDSATQRMAMYFIIARNRVRAGLGIVLPAVWISEVKSTPYYDVARDIIAALDAEFEDFSFDEAETAFLAIWIMQNKDVSLASNLDELLPHLAPGIRNAAQEITEQVSERTGIDFKRFERSFELLEHTLVPIYVAWHYDMDGCRRFDYETERRCLRSPLAVYLGNEFISAVRDVLGCSCSLSDTLLFSAMVMGLLEQVHFPLKPLRLLITSGVGPEYARIEGENLMRRFPSMIESVHACELYEIRGFDERDYDAVLTDVNSYGYNYSYPHAELGLVRSTADYGTVYDTILINAFDLDHMLPSEESIHLRSDVHPETVNELISIIKIECRHDSEVVRMLDLVRDSMKLSLEVTPALVRNGCLFLIAPLTDWGVREHGLQERIDYFTFSGSPRWGDEHVSSAFFILVDLCGEPARVKLMERVIYLLAMNTANLAPFTAQPLPFIREVLRDSLKLYPKY